MNALWSCQRCSVIVFAPWFERGASGRLSDDIMITELEQTCPVCKSTQSFRRVKE